MKKFITALLLAMFFAATPLAAKDAPDAATVLERVRAAVGEGAGSGVTLHGRADFLGNDVSYRVDIGAHGEFVQTLGGPFPFVEGYDGHTAWQVDFGGEIRHLHFGEGENVQVSGQIITHAWLGANSRLAFDDQVVTDEGSATLAFTHLDGLATGTVEIDTDTWRPTTWWLQGLDRGEQTVIMEGAMENVPGWYPASITAGQVDGRLTRTTLKRAEPLEAAPAAPAGGGPADTSFDPQQSAQLEVARGPLGHLLVRPLIDGRDLGWFIFDSGAGITSVDTRTVRALGLESPANVPAKGVGGRTDAPLHRLESLSLGPMTVANLAVAEFDLAFLDPHMGRPVAGVIGLGIFSRAVVELNHSDTTIALHDPAAFDGEAHDWLDMQLDNRLPVVAAQFESHEGLFAVDTGDSGNITFYPRATAELDLLSGRRTRGAHQGGVGGRVAVRRGRLEWLELGEQRFERLRVDFLQGTEGAHSQWITGRMGLGVLEPFVIIFDYPGSRLALEPRPAGDAGGNGRF